MRRANPPQQPVARSSASELRLQNPRGFTEQSGAGGSNFGSGSAGNLAGRSLLRLPLAGEHCELLDARDAVNVVENLHLHAFPKPR